MLVYILDQWFIFNISHEYFVSDSNYDNLTDYIYETVTYNNNDGTTNVCRFAKKKDGSKGVLPLILEELLAKRSRKNQWIKQMIYFKIYIYTWILQN